MSDRQPDMNRDPITKTPGSHPLGTAVGGTGGALAGAAVGSMFGPIGTLVGGGVGAIAGGSAGHVVAEQINPTGEYEYWREACVNCDYYDDNFEYERDYAPAYRYGWEARTEYLDRDWDDHFEAELKENWNELKRDSRLAWDKARYAVKDAFDRTDRTYTAYRNTDQYFEPRYSSTEYYSDEHAFDDYRPAYRFGTYARTRYPERDWDDQLEAKLKAEWEEFKGDTSLAWNRAKYAVKDAWHSVERTLPGDFDNDGR